MTVAQRSTDRVEEKPQRKLRSRRESLQGLLLFHSLQGLPSAQWVWVPPENRHIQRKDKKMRHALGARHIKLILAASIATVTEEESLQGNCTVGYGRH